MEILNFLASAGSAQAGAGTIWGTLILLIGLELVLGVDNVLIISILTGRLPEEKRKQARLIGLGIALFGRIGLLLGVNWLLGLREPVGHSVPGISSVPLLADRSIKDLLLIAGGLFLLFKAVKEIHHVVELKDEADGGNPVYSAFGAVIWQIALLDIVFSLDSVITAVGLTNHMIVIIVAVVFSFLLVLAFARQVGEFIQRHPALKILALSFLTTIGIVIILEGFGEHVPKAYIYLPMGFALCVEFLQMRYSVNRKKSS